MDLGIATDDDVRLAASVHLPEAAGPVACAVALHAAAAGTRDHPLYRHVAATLGEVGVAVCVYDRRGEGGSSGQPGGSLDRLAADGAAAARAVRELPEVDPDRVGVWGISQGGWLGPLAAVRDDAIAFVIAVSAPGVSPSTQMHFAMENVLDERGFTSADIATAHRVRERIEAAYRDGEATAALAALRTVEREPWFPYAYLPTAEDLADAGGFEIDLDAPEIFAQVRVPTLAIYGAWDRWVPVDASIDVWRAAFENRSHLLTVDRIADVGHMMTTPDDRLDLEERGPISPAYADVMTSWMRDAVTAPPDH